ncbi:MAG: glutathione-dependent disulfide-bond oxidoreductase [Sphingorhabdus sp.]
MTDTPDPANNQPTGYIPPDVWTWDSENGGEFASINRPISGATHDKVLPVGKHPLQLYSMGTPNGVKVTIMLEELLAAGHAGAEYDAWMILIGAGDQFSSGFVGINPNSKIPAMMDYSVDPPVRLFESGSMLFYLAEKFGAFLPTDTHKRAETMNWLMWQMGSAPYVGGGLGHFYAYAPFKMEYPINRFTMETKRQLHVLDTHLATNQYMVGDDYTIADMAIWPWYGSVMRDAYNVQEFLAVHEYPNLDRWVDLVGGRETVKRGRMVNRTFGQPESQLRERHDASDFQNNREDMVLARGGERI